MFKIICLLFAVIALSNARSVLKIVITSGHIFEGKNATGVNVKNNNSHQEIIWTESQDNLKIHFMKIFEDTGLVKKYDLDNLCDKQKRGSMKKAIRRILLNGLGNTNTCPIKKRTIMLSYPISFKFATVEEEICGPVIIMVNIVKNSQGDSNTPLLMSAVFRGTITGCN